MPFNGSGVFNPLPAPVFPAVPNTPISSTYYNQQFQDVFSGLGNCVTRDGQSPMAANLPMNGFKLTGMAAAIAAGQAIEFAQLAAVGGAALVGSTGPSTVQADLNADAAAIAANAANIAANTASIALLTPLSGAFAPTQDPAQPSMKVKLAAGSFVLSPGVAPISQAAQLTGTITAPAGFPRIDRVVVDAYTGAVSVVTGVPNAAPVAPAVPGGKFPVAQVLLQTSSTTITNSMITDERAASRPSGMTQNNQAGAYAALNTDFGQLLNFTGASSVAWTFNPTTLGNRWFATVKNAGTAAAVVTLTPSSGTIDGVATLALNPGDERVILCDGTNFTTYILAKNSQSGLLMGTYYITSTQAFAAIPGAANYDVIAVGAGGGGGGNGASAGTGGFGANAGARCRKLITAAAWGASQTITIGAAGTGVSGASGNNGGNTTVGAILTANGGQGGAIGTGNAAVSPPATSSGGDENGSGAYGLTTSGTTTTTGGHGGSTDYGVGGAGNPGGTSANGGAASGYGAGGGGSSTNSGTARIGGSGAPGLAIIRVYS